MVTANPPAPILYEIRCVHMSSQPTKKRPHTDVDSPSFALTDEDIEALVLYLIATMQIGGDSPINELIECRQLTAEQMRRLQDILDKYTRDGTSVQLKPRGDKKTNRPTPCTAISLKGKRHAPAQ